MPKTGRLYVRHIQETVLEHVRQASQRSLSASLTL